MFGMYILLQIAICSLKMAANPAALNRRQLLHPFDGVFTVAFTRAKPRKRRLTTRGLCHTACLPLNALHSTSIIFTEGQLG